MSWWTRLSLETIRACAVLTVLILLFVAIFVGQEAWPALRQVGPGSFFTDESWHPTQGTFGLLPMIVGSAWIVVGAVALAAPLGIGAALFNEFYAPRFLAAVLRRVLELLASVPSVVYGLWGLVVLVPLIGSLRPPGSSVLAGVAILCLMVLPTMAMSAGVAFRSLPRDYLHAAAALGLRRSTTLLHVVLPACKLAIAEALILQVGRAAGETTAIMMVSGNVVQLPKSLFDPVRTLTANMALEMAYATGAHRSALFVGGLALALFLLVVTAIAHQLRGGGKHA